MKHLESRDYTNVDYRVDIRGIGSDKPQVLLIAEGGPPGKRTIVTLDMGAESAQTLASQLLDAVRLLGGVK